MSTVGPNYRDFIEGIVVNPVIEQNDPPNTRLTDVQIPVVYGLQRITPPIMWYRLSDYDSNSLIVTYALSEGPCLGIYRLFVDDLYVKTDQEMALINDGSPNGTANTIVNVDEGPYADIAQFEFMSGREYDLNTISPGAYDSKILKAHIAVPNQRPQYPNELCYLVVRYIARSGENIYRDIPKLTIDLFGKQVPYSSPNDTVLKYSTNPAKHLWDYMTNDRYGAGFDASILDTTSFQAGVTFYDANTTVNLTNGQGSVTKRITSNLVVDTSQTVRSNIDSMLSVNRAFIPYIDGKFVFDVEKADSVEVDFTENSIIGEVKVVYPDVGSKYNKINYTFLDAERDFIPTRKSYPPEGQEGDLLAEDNNFQNSYELNLPSITDPYMAERLARTFLEKSRKQPQYTFRIFKDAWKYKVGDICRIKTTVPDLDYVEARIMTISFNEDNTLDIEAHGHDDTWYAPFVDFFQTPEDYSKPLIPTPGGVLLPQIPTQPISVTPPTTGNPDSGDPGHPGDPTTLPILPVQPGEDLPAKPTAPVFVYTVDNVKNHGNITTIGPNNEYYLGDLRFNSNEQADGFRYFVPAQFEDQGGQIRFENFPPRYSLDISLTHRNQDETEVGIVYEVTKDNAGNKLFGHKFGNNIYLWDPENPTLTARVYDVRPGLYYNQGGKFFPGEVNFNTMPFPRLTPGSNRYRVKGVLRGANIAYHVSNSPYADNRVNLTASNLDQIELELPTNFYWVNGSFDITVKFFKYKNTARSGFGFLPSFISYIGEHTFTFSNAKVAANPSSVELALDRQAHSASLATTYLQPLDPPF